MAEIFLPPSHKANGRLGALAWLGGTPGTWARIVLFEILDLTREGTMKLKYRIKRWQMKRALRNNAGRIAVFAAAAAGLAVGIREWRARA